MNAESLLKLAESLEKTARELRELATQPGPPGVDTSWKLIRINDVLVNRPSAAEGLAEHGFRTLGDLDGIPVRELGGIRSLGIKTLQVLQTELHKYDAAMIGICLK